MQNNERSRGAAVPRRAALGASVAAAVPATVAPTPKSPKPSVKARSAARVVGANDRIRTGHVGVGGMGFAHVRDFVRQSEAEKGIEVVAVCDVYKRRKER